jgi:hypothetical protein
MIKKLEINFIVFVLVFPLLASTAFAAQKDWPKDKSKVMTAIVRDNTNGLTLDAVNKCRMAINTLGAALSEIPWYYDNQDNKACSDFIVQNYNPIQVTNTATVSKIVDLYDAIRENYTPSTVPVSELIKARDMCLDVQKNDNNLLSVLEAQTVCHMAAQRIDNSGNDSSGCCCSGPWLH